MTREYALLGLLAAMWGSSYYFIALALESFGPISLMALRVTGAAIVLTAIMRAKGMAIRVPDSQTCGHLYCLALLNSIVAWPLLAWGQQYVDSALATILNSMPPIFVVLFSAIINGKNDVDQRSMYGVLIGWLGVIAIVGTSAPSLGGNQLAQFACVLSAACYGVVALYKKPFEHLSGLEMSTYTMIFAALTLTPIALVTEEIGSITVTALMAAIGLSVFSTAFAMLIYFRLQRTIGSLGVSSQSYLRVIVGVGLGVLLLGETLEPEQFVGAGMVLVSLGLISTSFGKK